MNIIERALARLERDGWTQGSLAQDGKCCVMGALYAEHVGLEHPETQGDFLNYDLDMLYDSAEVAAARRALDRVLPDDFHDNIPYWNDDARTDFAAVRDALKRASEFL